MWGEYLHCGREFWHLEVFLLYLEVFVSIYSFIKETITVVIIHIFLHIIVLFVICLIAAVIPFFSSYIFFRNRGGEIDKKCDGTFVGEQLVKVQITSPSLCQACHQHDDHHGTWHQVPLQSMNFFHHTGKCKMMMKSMMFICKFKAD